MVMSIAVEAALRGGRYIWGAPTYDQVRVGWDETRHALGRAATFNEGKMQCDMPTGGRIIYRSLDNPDNARGHSADGVIVDEVADVAPEAWVEVLRPMLIDTGGWAWLLGTPKGRNWLYQLWHNSQGLADWGTFHAPTLGVSIGAGGLARQPHPLENPHVPFAEIEQLWRSMPERVFRQEILAEFVEDGGGVFRRVRECATAERQDKAVEGHYYVFGVDWARTNDYTVISVVDVSLGELVYLDRFSQIDYHTQTNRLVALYERFSPTLIISEGNSMGGPLTEDLQARGLPVRRFDTTQVSKAVIIQGLELAFERGTIRIPPDDAPGGDANGSALIAELESYEQERLQSGIRYGAPSGGHDDCVMSLALAWSHAARAGGGAFW